MGIESINLDMMPWSEYLNPWLTELAQQEYMKDYDMTSKSSMKMRITDESVTEIRAEATFNGNSLSIVLHKGDTNPDEQEIWVSNWKAIATGLLPDKLNEIVYSNIDLLSNQVKDYIIPYLGGVLA